MPYLSVNEAAQRWGVSPRSVRNYCAQGRVPGAVLVGKTWSIPNDAQKPARLNARHTQGAQTAQTQQPAPAPSPLVNRLTAEKRHRTPGGIYHKVQIELTYNSNHMEGSQLTHDQTLLIFETSTVDATAPLRVDDIVEAANHFRCIDHVIDHWADPLTEHLVKDLHRMLKQSTTDANNDWFAVGDYKRLPNEVGGRQTTAPKDVAARMQELLTAYERQPRHDLEDIVGFHVAFERIHPFQDGNGRVGRLLMFKECLRNGIAPFVIADEAKLFYYRGLARWDSEKGWLLDTCRAAQDAFKVWLDYFEIPYGE